MGMQRVLHGLHLTRIYDGPLVVPCRAGLLTSGAVMLYTTYLLFSALSSEPYDESCMRGSGTTPRWVQVRT